MTDIQIGEIEKNQRESIRIALREYKGHRFCDLRIMALNKAGEFVFTSKGLAVAPGLLPELIGHLQQAHAEALKQGLA